jgi:GH25 family lysozyme M1 (1,4-beta-N-acetylmuramidase)
LGPDKRDAITVSETSPQGKAQFVTLNVNTTGPTASIANHPEIKIFRAPDTYPIQGIDVSHYDEEVDWRKVASSGKVQFAYLKATEGTNFIDETFARNWSQSRANGIVRGAYHVFNFCKPAPEQFENIKRVVPKDPDALPIAIDVEWTGIPKRIGQAKCDDVKTIRQNVRELAKAIRSEYKKTPVIHGFAETFRDVIDDTFLEFPVWLLDYKKTGDAGPSLVGRNTWSIWQFGSNATIPGLKSKVSANVFFGTRKQFNAFRASGSNIARSGR